MKTRRVIVSLEIETDVPAAQLRKATLRVTCPGNIKYLEEARVNIVRASTEKRGKAKKETK